MVHPYLLAITAVWFSARMSGVGIWKIFFDLFADWPSKLLDSQDVTIGIRGFITCTVVCSLILLIWYLLCNVYRVAARLFLRRMQINNMYKTACQ